mmetsp:Transcript_12511/g.50095  ORF Transcript_12511/g.50095 Transcript_12511/m.50095 type:complete len:223 (-) Transcript_12511:589-1257(-)
MTFSAILLSSSVSPASSFAFFAFFFFLSAPFSLSLALSIDAEAWPRDFLFIFLATGEGDGFTFFLLFASADLFSSADGDRSVAASASTPVTPVPLGEWTGTPSAELARSFMREFWCPRTRDCRWCLSLLISLEIPDTAAGCEVLLVLASSGLLEVRGVSSFEASLASSLGERRVRALALPPVVLLSDEPRSGVGVMRAMSMSSTVAARLSEEVENVLDFTAT